MVLIKKETIKITQKENDALDEMYGLTDMIEGLASDEYLKRIAEHLRHWMDELMDYVEEDLV